MPNKHTFSVPPIHELVLRHANGVIVDPFANTSTIATITNDIDPDCGADYSMDALEFLRTLDTGSVDTVLFDPPYSPRQVSECYKKMGRTVNMQTTQASFWGKLKDEIMRVTGVGGKVITCAWNSGGIGKSRGFSIVEVLLVPHGGWHNDTIVTVEVKDGGAVCHTE